MADQNPQRVSILSWLQLEVTKYLQSNRVSEQGLRELESKLQMEIYLREKKEAILEDRSATLDNEDAKSNLEKVQAKLPALAQTIDDTRSQRSAASQAHKSLSQSIAAMSTANKSVVKERQLDEQSLFADPAETVSLVSGLESEADEWNCI